MAAKKCALYARLSLSTEESVSIERQLQAGRAYAAARGFEVVLEAADDGVSATRKAPPQRPGWQRVMSVAPQVDAVIIWKVDRLARKVLDFLNADSALQALGAGIVAVEDPIDMTTPQGRAFATVLAVFGEMEAAALSARQRAARAYLVAQGRTHGGRHAWTHENTPNPDGPGGRLVPTPAKAEAVRKALVSLEAGASIGSIGRQWEELFGEGFTVGRMGRLLSNPILMGATTRLGELVREEGRIRIDPARAILSAAEFHRLQDLLKARSTKRDRLKPLEEVLLRHLLLCSSCGGTMHLHIWTEVHSYRCPGRYCAGRSVSKRRIEEYMERRLLAEAGDKVITRMIAIDGQEDSSGLVDELEGALEGLEVDLAAVEDEDEGLALLRERRRLRGALKEAQQVTGGTIFTEESATVAERWAQGDSDERNALLRDHFWRVVILPGKRGKKGLDESRVVVTYSEDDPVLNFQQEDKKPRATSARGVPPGALSSLEAR